MSNNALQTRLSRQMTALKSMHDGQTDALGMITVDASNRITGISAAVGDSLHVNVEPYVGCPLPDFVKDVFEASDADRILCVVDRAMLAGEVAIFELQAPIAQRSPLTLKVHVTPLHGPEPETFRVVLTLEDITAYKPVGLTGFMDEDIRLYSEAVELATKLAKEKEHYKRQSMHDALTGAYNHGHFQRLLTHEIARAQRYDHSLGLLMVDIDDFKEYNDAYGHPAGNWALRDVASILQYQRRRTDQLARYGGEEFALVLPETDAPGAMALAERLRCAVEQESRGGMRFRRPITVSIGVAVYPPDPPYKLVMLADERMYRAKEAGKNRVCGLDGIL